MTVSLLRCAECRGPSDSAEQLPVYLSYAVEGPRNVYWRREFGVDLPGGDRMCDGCSGIYATECGGCAVWFRDSDGCGNDCQNCDGCGTVLPDGDVCDECEVCARCGATVADGNTVRTARGNTICYPCARSHYWECGVCDRWNRDSRSECWNGCSPTSDDDCDEYCSCGCQDDGGSSDGLINSYSYKPAPVFHGEGPLYLGAEIEVSTSSYGRRGAATTATRHLGDLGYLKEDSSIGSGFEIVTHPMSYEWALANFPWHMLQELVRDGAEADDSCGIHVHVSKAAFKTTCHRYRWMKFIYRNQRQVQLLARRESGQWARFSDYDRARVINYAKDEYGDRYRAINTNNHSTYELRIFASSLNEREVKAAMGFAAASVEYTRKLSAADIVRGGGWKWSAFVGWLREQPMYGDLLEELEGLECVS